jgi:excisionase family DNA binding protein
MENPKVVNPKFLTVQSAAHQLGLSVWTVRAWCYHGKITSAKLGSRLMVPAGELDRIAAEAIRPRLEPSK